MSNSNERIKLDDNLMSCVTKLSEGNPGAANALMEMFTLTPSIDLDNPMGGMGYMLLLDSYGIYGTDIYILHSDICNKDMAKMLAVLRSTQLGLFNESVLKDACHRQDRSGRDMIPINNLVLKLKQRLPNFVI